jgi:hypothetical protein
MCNSGRASVRSVVHQVQNNNVAAALLGDTGVTLASNVFVDSFGEKVVEYDPSGECVNECTPIDTAGSQSIAINPAGAPEGGVSPLAWVIIGCLITALLAVVAFAKAWTDKLYNDLKECNGRAADREEDTVGQLKVLTVQMEKARAKALKARKGGGP